MTSLIQRGRELAAEVAGSELAPYEVRVVFDEAGIVESSCSCPYDWGGACKHVVATLLACLHEPESVRELPALEETLSGLEREELEDLVLKLAERYPSLSGVIEGELALSDSSEPRPVNADAIRRRLRASIQAPGYMEPYDDYWHPSGDLDEAHRVLEGAWSLIRADDARGALQVLEAITEEYLDAPDWEMMGDYGGDLLDLFEEAGAAFAEALLSVELTPHEKEDYSAKLDVWWGELGDYGVGDTFGAAFRAVEQGWSYPPLVGVLEGRITDEDFFDELLDDPLTIARLNVLERRGRHEEYLRLSQAAGEDTSHAIMLVRLDRAEEAVEYASRHLSTPEQALAVAEALREQGDTEGALRLGERGLSLEGRKVRLAGWVRDLAEGLGRRGLALRAAVAAFHADPGLVPYQRVGELAGERWPEHRERLLDHLRQSTSYLPIGHVEVFLHEDLVGDAIAAVEGEAAGSFVGSLVARVADAAIESHPDWVIETCRRPAEEIMNEGRSKHYEEAVSWLAKARDAHLASGREQEWRAYLEELIAHHQRKYKLRPMLEDLAV
ncbi:MAG: SWIM zinc finger domain-containing protein [Rubrobacter sp.]|nr:SWIM zinc finger domain-containing protein [Rubrobacter sp.]